MTCDEKNIGLCRREGIGNRRAREQKERKAEDNVVVDSMRVNLREKALTREEEGESHRTYKSGTNMKSRRYPHQTGDSCM